MSQVKFIEESHRYFTDDERELIGVSSFAKKFEVKKNWREITEKYARKHKMTVRQVEELWEMKRVKGTEAGTIVHKIKEQETLGSGTYRYEGVDFGIQECPYENNLKRSLDITQIENGRVYPELMIYDLELGICGQSDEVVIHNNTINILDFKTDKAIARRSRSADWGEPEYFTEPIAHLENCAYNMYALKMSLYMYLLWKANKGRFKPGKLVLKWCPIERDEEGIPVLYDGVPKILREEWIELPYRKKEVVAMLETLKKN